MEKKFFFNSFLILIVFSISLFTTIWGPHLWGGIVGMTLLVLISFLVSKLDILHPLTWFSPVFYLYSISAPLLVAIGETAYINYDKTLFIEWIALFVFIVLIGKPKKIDLKDSTEKIASLDVIVFPIFVVSTVLTFTYLGYVYTSGIDSKYTLTNDNSIFRIFVPFFSIFILSFTILLTHSFAVKKKFPKFLVIFSLAYSVLALLIIGERDIVLRIGIVLVLLYHIFYKKIKKKNLVLVALIMLISIPIMGNLRNSAVSGSIDKIEEEKSILVETLNSEFIAAPRNLQIVLDYEDLWTYFYGETYLWDLKMAFVQGDNSAAVWFNNTFFPDLVRIGGGNGFTIVGEGYINFGILGVIAIFAFLALFLRVLYNQAIKNILWLIVYITSIPIFLYLIRGDLAVLFANVSKHIILPLLIIYFVKIIVKKRLRRQNMINNFKKEKYIT